MLDQDDEDEALISDDLTISMFKENVADVLKRLFEGEESALFRQLGTFKKSYRMKFGA